MIQEELPSFDTSGRADASLDWWEKRLHWANELVERRDVISDNELERARDDVQSAYDNAIDAKANFDTDEIEDHQKLIERINQILNSRHEKSAEKEREKQKRKTETLARNDLDEAIKVAENIFENIGNLQQTTHAKTQLEKAFDNAISAEVATDADQETVAGLVEKLNDRIGYLMK